MHQKKPEGLRSEELDDLMEHALTQHADAGPRHD